MDRTVFDVRNVTYYCTDGNPALRGVSLAVRERETVALLGANGSGKSTLLHVLDGLVFPQEGEVRFLGRPLSEDALGDLAFNGFFRKTVGLVFQNSDVQLFSPTVRDEIAFGPTQLGLPGADVEERVNDLLAMLNMEALRDRPPYRLSGGEKKKVAIASTLAVNPDVLLLDEPTDGLDPRTQAWLIELLDQLRRGGKTIVLASHDLAVVGRLADRVVVLGEDHRVKAEGPTAAVLDDRDLLMRVNLIHEHLHSHDGETHDHPHGHFAEHDHDHHDP